MRDEKDVPQSDAKYTQLPHTNTMVDRDGVRVTGSGLAMSTQRLVSVPVSVQCAPYGLTFRPLDLSYSGGKTDDCRSSLHRNRKYVQAASIGVLGLRETPGAPTGSAFYMDGWLAAVIP